MNSDHVYLPTEPDPEGRGLRGRRKGRVRFVRSEELGAPSPFHLTGPHRRLSAEVVCVAGESARMLPIKSSEVPPAPPPLPALCPACAVMAHTEALYKRQPESKLCTPMGCSLAPAMRGVGPCHAMWGRSTQWGWRVQGTSQEQALL